MGYELYVEHPESFARRADDFAAWSLWAPKNAPWTGVAISDQAALLQAICGPHAELQAELKGACLVLDLGGILQPRDVERILDSAGTAMPEKVRAVFEAAKRGSYPVRVVFSKGFGSLTASAYLAKHGSA
jgi:hypothetical protein